MAATLRKGYRPSTVRGRSQSQMGRIRRVVLSSATAVSLLAAATIVAVGAAGGFDASGCFVIPASDFVVGKNLGTATLNATVDENNLCEGFLVPVGDSAPAKAGGPGGGGFTFPLTVTGSWTGTGVIAKIDNHGVFRCGGFVSNTHSSTRS